MTTELLARQLATLESELSKIDEEVALAIAGQGERDLTFDIEAYQAKKRNIEAKLPLAEVNLLQHQLPDLKAVYRNAKRDLKILELGELPEAAKDYDEKLKALEDSYQRHGLLQFKAYGLEQTILETVEEIAVKRRRLKQLISETTGVEADRPSDNLLIRS